MGEYGSGERTLAPGQVGRQDDCMALSVVNGESPSRESESIDWATVQFAQFVHDEKYHREISRLPVQDRLRHMTLHFAKYAGRLQDDPTSSDFKKIATDTMIIAISCANILNVDLTTKKPGVGMDAARGAFVKRLAISAGRMAAACERLDHLEDFPFRSTLTDEALSILATSLELFRTEGWDPTQEMEKRLAPIKSKSIFHGKL